MMSKGFEKVIRVVNYLQKKKKATPSELREVMGDGAKCSRHTLYRTLAVINDTLEMEVKYDPRERVYYLDSLEGKKVFNELSFTPSDLLVLISLLQIIKELDFLINKDFKNKLLIQCGRDVGDVVSFLSKIKVIPTHNRRINIEIFKEICQALKTNRKLWIKYNARTGVENFRVVSPIHLVRYRDNWYLDAYCHLRNEIRIFSVDRILRAEVLNKPAERIDESEIKKFFESAYGIFTGKPKAIARLKFSRRMTKWVAEEEWHPNQKIKKKKDGSCVIEIPYSDERELIMDILKYGDDIMVLGPKSLKQMVITKLNNALKNYSKRRR